MSLLTNPWLAVSMGLLANNGPSLTPVNPWRGIGEGLMNAQNAQYAEQQSAYEQMRMQQEQQKMAAEQQRQQQLQAAIQGLPPEQQQLAMASPDAFFKARIDQQFAKPAESVSIKTAGELGLQGYAPETPVEVKMNGGQIVDYTPMTPPAPPALPADIQGYEYAKAQGYGGSFENWKMDSARAGATKVEMGAGDRASPADVASMVYADGSPVLPGTAWPEIIARGGRVLTGEEKAARTAQGTQSAKDEQAAVKGGNLFDNYTAAASTYQSGMAPAGKSREQAKVARRALVTWYAKNVLGTPGAEPSPSLYDKAEEIIPDFAGPWDTAMFGARMEEIKGTIGASLGEKKQDQGMKDVEMVYDPIKKRLVPVK